MNRESSARDKVRVGFLFPGSFGSPGVGTTAFHQIVGLNQNGIEVALYCARVSRCPPDGVKVECCPVPEKLRSALYKFGLAGWYWALFQIWVVWKLGRRQAPDLVHAWPGACGRVATWCKRQGVPLLLERPNQHINVSARKVRIEYQRLSTAIPRGQDYLFSASRRSRERADYEAASFLLAPSEAVRRSLLAEGIAEARVLSHRYGCEVSEFSSCRLGREPSRSGPIRFLYFGRIEPRKGIHFLLEAWQKAGLRESENTLSIKGPAERDYLRELRDRFPWSSQLIVPSFASAADVYSAADVLVLPSVEEGSALVTYESRAAGCLLIASDEAGVLGEDEVDFVSVPAACVDALARQLARVCSDDGLRCRLSRLSDETMRQLDWSAAGELLASLYRKVSSSSSG